MKSRRMKLTEGVAHMREKCIQIVVRESKGKHPLWGHSHRLEDNIKTDLEGIE